MAIEVIDLLIPAGVFLSVMAVGGGVAAVLHRRRMLQPRLQRVKESSFVSAMQESEGQVNPLLSPLASLGRIAARGGTSPQLRQELAKAGYYGEAAPAVFLGSKMILLTIALLGSAALIMITELPTPLTLVLSISITGMLFFAPNIALDMIKRRRSTELRQNLPDAIDLLEVCVTAGMGLDMAWNAVADEIRSVSPVLADEMALTNLEMQLGAARSDAMRRMAERTGAEELSSLVAMLVQSDRFGTSIGETLRTFAASMREGRSQRAEEAAEKMAVKILFPMVLFIFPVMLIITVGPAGIAIAEMISEH